MEFWQRYSTLGISEGTEPYLFRSIILTNRTAFIIFLLSTLLLAILLSFTGFTPGIQRTSYILVIYTFIPLLNYYGLNIVSRLLVSTIIPLYIIWVVGVSTQSTLPLLTSSSYFPPRMLTMITCIIPVIVFDTFREKKWMIAGILVCMACTVGYDFAIEIFGHTVEVYKTSYTFIYYNTVFFIEFVALVSAAFMLKRMVDRSDNKNFELLRTQEINNQELVRQNYQLSQLNQEIETQNEEMVAQAEELRANQEKLADAYELIQKQKEQLHIHNEHLEDLVAQKNKALIDANEELSKYNSELRQFSHTISHNLRAPVARLIGLENLLTMDSEGLSENQLQLMALLRQSAKDLDTIIQDLNKIIDIRSDLYRIKEKVFFQQEFDRAHQSLEHQLPEDAEFLVDFSHVPFMYAIRPLLNSILFNLLSNAIKYRSHNRKLVISVSTKQTTDGIRFTFADNGLGMNLDQFGKDLFGMYKRFHTHTDGKGLGLYLVKSQVETLNGTISVKSELNGGTTFTIFFKHIDAVDGQICFDSEYGQIYYNARTNTAGISWKKQVTSEAYRTLFEKCLEVLRIYNTPHWISDLRKQGQVLPEDQLWMISTIIPDAVRNGLIHIVGVYDPVQHNEGYLERIRMAIEQAGSKVEFTTSTKEAEAWIEEEIRKEKNA
ncbi:MAG: hypothetical protein KF845_08815 [Cyclobacteriaceae bacterium]|nr:hypothetical protein [Cyclobacteriaceae bacterium]